MSETLAMKQLNLAYHKLEGQNPGIIYCGGFRSDMTGTKVLAVEEYCRKNNLSFVRFDYRGHGQSPGDFADFSISDWRNDALAVLDQLTSGPQIIVGSSMGGWISLLVALARPERIIGLVGIASAPDFTEELIWQNLTSEHRELLLKNKVIYNKGSTDFENYPITLKLLEEGRNNLLLKQKINLNIPIVLIHGMQDKDVPWDYSLRLLEQITSGKVTLKLIKDGTHRLMREEDLAVLINSLEEIIFPSTASPNGVLKRG